MEVSGGEPIALMLPTLAGAAALGSLSYQRQSTKRPSRGHGEAGLHERWSELPFLPRVALHRSVCRFRMRETSPREHSEMSDDTVTQWIAGLEVADGAAAQRIWERYFNRLIPLVRRKLNSSVRPMADEEDVVLCAFETLFRNAAEGRFPHLRDRDDLWKLLLTITDRKAKDHHKHATRQKRGGGRVAGEADLASLNASRSRKLDEMGVSPQPSPEFAAQLAEEVQRLLDELQDETLRRVATMKMDGSTNDEIASALGCSVRSVKRKLQVIRTIWS